MTIRRGQAWGGQGRLRPGAPVVGNDAELRAHVERARRAGPAPIEEIGVLGGDLCKTLGGPGDLDRLAGDLATRVLLDVVRAELDGAPHWFVAHLVAHQPGRVGEAAVAMNAEWLGDWKLGPRAHPGDGLVDVTFGQLGWQQRLAARKRAATGTHLPHPKLRVERSATVSFTFRRATPVLLDGEHVGRFRHVALVVEPDALPVVL